MHTKLSLSISPEIVQRAKKYASHNKVNLSTLIEAYLDRLTLKEKAELEISPFVKSISMGTKQLPVDLDYKEAYMDFLEEKHK